MSTKYTVVRDISQDMVYNAETGTYENAPVSDMYIRNSQLDLVYSSITGEYELVSFPEENPVQPISVLPYREYTLLNLHNKKPYFLAYKDKIFSLCLASLHNIANCVYKITPTPSNAKVEFLINDSIFINAANEVSVYAGTTVEYIVSAPGYATVRGSSIINSNKTEDVILTPYYTFTIVPTPADATVNFTASGYIADGNSITVLAGTFVSYSVSKEWHITQTNVVQVTDNLVLNVELELPEYTLTINPIPSDAALTITADGYTSVGNSITVPAGTLVTYTLEKDKYAPMITTIQVAEDTTLTPQLQYLGIWERVGKMTGYTASSSYRKKANYSSYYGKYYIITDGGSSGKSISFSSDLLNWTSISLSKVDWMEYGDESLGILSTGQVAVIHMSDDYDSSISKRNVVIETALLNKDFTFTTPQTVYSTTNNSYTSTDLWGGELINNQLCFYFMKPDDVDDSSTFLTLYTTNGTSWSTATFYTVADDYPQLTILGSNGSYMTAILDTPNGYQLYKCTSATAKTAGNILWSSGNMTGAYGFYDGYAFVYDGNLYNYYSTNGTSGINYNTRAYAETSSITNQIYINDTTLGKIYLTYNTTTSAFRVVNVDYTTLYGEINTDINIYNIFGVIDNYVYIVDKDEYLYKAKYQDVINNLT